MPNTWSIYTWNTQGKFSATTKLAEINRWFPAHAVVCLQEGGVGHPEDGGNWKAYGGVAPGAFNPHCTNYVLLDKAQEALAKPHVLKNKDNALVVGGGQAGRTPAAVGVGNVLYISWHSLAAKSNEDTAMLVAAVDGNPEYTKQYDTIVIGGDFNASPADIHGVITRGTERQRLTWNYKERYVVNSGQITHPGSKSELDFFIVLSTSVLTGLAASRVQVTPSDHKAVRMKIDL
jgi:hypothetical protein